MLSIELFDVSSIGCISFSFCGIGLIGNSFCGIGFTGFFGGGIFVFGVGSIFGLIGSLLAFGGAKPLNSLKQSSQTLHNFPILGSLNFFPEQLPQTRSPHFRQ